MSYFICYFYLFFRVFVYLPINELSGVTKQTVLLTLKQFYSAMLVSTNKKIFRLESESVEMPDTAATTTTRKSTSLTR